MSIETTPAETTIENAETVPQVTVFSKNDCTLCVGTKNRFTAKGIPFREINVEEDTEPRAEFGGKTPLEHVLKYGNQMPFVVVENGSWGEQWSGARPDKIVELGLLFERLDALIPAEDRKPVKSLL